MRMWFFFHQACDPDIFANINCFLRIVCTTPAMNYGKRYFEACQRISARHYDNGKIVRLDSDEHSLRKARPLRRCSSAFCGKIPRRMPFMDPVFDETQNLKTLTAVVSLYIYQIRVTAQQSLIRYN